MHTSDHHSAYLTRAVEALTPEGRKRVDELLEELAEAVGGHERVLHFAEAREAEANLGRTTLPGAPEPGNMLTEQELDVLIAGFTTIRDQEPLDDVGDWANAVLALLEDERAQSRSRPSA
jgi:hypothetical protein